MQLPSLSLKLLANKLIDSPEWYYRKRYNLAPTDNRYLDADDVDIRLDLYMHAEHERKMRLLEGHDNVIESDPATEEAFDRALATSVAIEEDGGEMDADAFEAAIIAEVSAVILENQREDGASERARALRALKTFLGDSYRERDFREAAEE